MKVQEFRIDILVKVFDDELGAVIHTVERFLFKTGTQCLIAIIEMFIRIYAFKIESECRTGPYAKY